MNLARVDVAQQDVVAQARLVERADTDEVLADVGLRLGWDSHHRTNSSMCGRFTYSGGSSFYKQQST